MASGTVNADVNRPCCSASYVVLFYPNSLGDFAFILGINPLLAWRDEMYFHKFKLFVAARNEQTKYSTSQE